MTDLLYNENGLIIEDGDFKVGFSDDQDIERILTVHKGEILRSPLLGVGMSKYLNGTVKLSQIKRDIKKELEADGFNVLGVTYDNETQNLEVNALRK